MLNTDPLQQELELKLTAAQHAHKLQEQRVAQCRREEAEAVTAVKEKRDQHTQAEAELSQLRPAGRAAQEASPIDGDDDPQTRRIRELQQELSDDTDKLHRLRTSLDIQRDRVNQCRDALNSVRSHIEETTESLQGLETSVDKANKNLEARCTPRHLYMNRCTAWCW